LAADGSAPANGAVLEVGEAQFEREVIERSKQVPVVVDFWAEWCAPCRTLGPMIENAVVSRNGDVVLAKVDIDANQGLAQRYGIRGIPAVKAFRDGEVVDEFTGAIPQRQVERFIDNVVPSEADALVAEGDEQSLRRALELEPGNPAAATALARLLLERGETQQALELVEGIEGDFGAEGLAARAQLQLSGSGDPQLGDALAALADGDHERALEGLASALEGADEDTREQIRKLMVGLFAELGADHPLSKTYRRRLAAALY
jgi:putative thioredoxin